MKWIEHIRVRSSSIKLQKAISSLREQVNKIEEKTSCIEIFFMQHAIYTGDLSIVVVWKNDMKPEYSREGLMMAEQLQKLGPIDHAIWIPAEK